jgi:2'-5' RNA ligase
VKELYSIAVCPPEEFVDAVSSMKKKLSEQIGWFNSKNSEAHITFNVFMADEGEIQTWENYLAGFCRSIQPFDISFFKTGTFPRNGAFYLDPEDRAKEHLIAVMKKFHQSAPYKIEKTSLDPHLSIARRLKPDQIKAAKELWPDETFSLKFNCNNLAVRKFNNKMKQYAVEKRFDFGNSEA